MNFSKSQIQQVVARNVRRDEAISSYVAKTHYQSELLEQEIASAGFALLATTSNSSFNEFTFLRIYRLIFKYEVKQIIRRRHCVV